MWILNRLEIARQRADLMFGSIAEDGSLGSTIDSSKFSLSLTRPAWNFDKTNFFSQSYVVLVSLSSRASVIVSQSVARHMKLAL